MERRLAAILAADVAGYSRLMHEDEEGALATLREFLARMVHPAIERHRGRVVKQMGDGLLAEFGSAVEALRCGVEIQREVGAANSAILERRRMWFRIGIHVGDVIFDGGDIFGDGVNIAARLESIAECGSVFISRQAFDQIDHKVPVDCRPIGPVRLKNIADPVEVFAIRCDGAGPINSRQEIHYCRSTDGVRIAYAVTGAGPPIVKAANWLNHLEHDWESPVWNHVLRNLSRDHTLVRYDGRGNGLSDWEVDTISLDAWLSDLEAVIESAGLKEFPMLGVSQGCGISIAYAVKHPERVSRLILYGGFAAGRMVRAQSEQEKQQLLAIKTLMLTGWGANHAAFRQMFTSAFMPEATKEQADMFNEMQRKSASPAMAARYLQAAFDFDVRHLLPLVRTPTLVLHVRGDLTAPLDAGREMAAGIAGARLVELPGKNHLFLEKEPAAERFFEEVRKFLAI